MRHPFTIAVLAAISLSYVPAMQPCAQPATAASSNETGATDVRTSIDGQVYWVEELARGLRFPSSAAWLPNGEMLIAERQGGLRVFRDGKLDPNAVVGVPAGFQNLYNGLKEVIVASDYDVSRRIYLLITEGTPDRHHSAIFRARYERGRLSNVERIFRTQDVDGLTSGRMLLLPDQTLLIGITDTRMSPRPDLPQRLDSHAGKILRINRDGSIPADNPFLDRPDVLPEIWAYGLRVPTGLHWDPQGKSVWEVEPGPMGGDEFNLLKAGGNFGWAAASWGFEYDGDVVTPKRTGAGMEDPIAVWTPSVTPSGLTRYHGTAYPSWDGDFFVGYLYGRALERLRISERRVVFRESMLADVNERLRDVRTGPDGLIYVLTDHENGRMLRLNPGRPSSEERPRTARRLEPDRSSAIQPVEKQSAAQTLDDVQAGRKAFLERCAGCHRVGAALEGGRTGPDLSGVYGRRAGSAAGFAYSGAMAASARIWDDAALDQFMADPGGYVPGTTMGIAPVSDPDMRRRITTFIKQEREPGAVK